MAWKECDRVSLRREFIGLAMVDGCCMSALCERFEISRKTGYKWLARYRAEGTAGLADRSRRPHRLRSPTSKLIEELVLAVRDEHPCWGGRKIRRRLQDLGHQDVPAASTITAILHRHGLIDVAESAKRQPFVRFERASPNELWQMDFKGDFKMSNGRRCYPLTVLDDHSRYSIVLQACGNQRRGGVQQHLTAAFDRYGLPQAMLMDNGPPWGVAHVRRGRTCLSVWLMDLDIAVLHGRPYHPQTQGKEERFHRTLKLEVLQGRTFDDLSHTQGRFDPWRTMYNHERPHEALGMEVPARRYRVSPRAYDNKPTSFEYDTTFAVRKVDREGRVVFHNHEYYVGKAFSTKRVGIRSSGVDGEWAVYYRTFRVSTLDEQQGHPRRSRPASSAAPVRSAHSSSRTKGK